MLLGDELFATGSWAGQVAKCPLKRGYKVPYITAVYAKEEWRGVTYLARPGADGVAAKRACYKDLGESWVSSGDLIMGTVIANLAGESVRAPSSAPMYGH